MKKFLLVYIFHYDFGQDLDAWMVTEYPTSKEKSREKMCHTLFSLIIIMKGFGSFLELAKENVLNATEWYCLKWLKMINFNSSVINIMCILVQ